MAQTARLARAPSARDLASYLVALRPILLGATEARRVWVRRIGVLMEDARRGDRAQVASAAGTMGRETLTTFRNSRLRVEQLRPPRGCGECHRALVQWLEKLITACELLAAVGRTGLLEGIHEAQEVLADSRIHAHRFNAEYGRLVGELRRRVAAAGARPRRGQTRAVRAVARSTA
ncbi:MAG TPA: hypothetical protein VG370_20000 [Chloroflexota bacterium]|jgi:hypothetical protein|nr:hypothetical protein [Chloroflexota bacterium]